MAAAATLPLQNAKPPKVTDEELMILGETS